MEEKSCAHDWIKLKETDYGEMDYSSYGGGVEHFVVTLYCCRKCGVYYKEASGDFNGDPSEYLQLDDKDEAEVRYYLEKVKKQ